MIELHVLGTLALRDTTDGHALQSVLAQPTRTALLAYLATDPSREFHSRDTLLGVFWPDSSEKRARNSLNQAIFVLRRALGSEVIVTRGPEEIGVDPGRLWCDAAAFQQALERGNVPEALELYGGDLLAGLHLSDGLPFEHWLQATRTQLRKQATEAALTLAEEHEAAENLVEASHWTRRASEWLPYDETVLRKLLTLLAKAGDRAGAIQEYETFRERLATDLELEPSPETESLFDELHRRTAVEAVPVRVPMAVGGSEDGWGRGEPDERERVTKELSISSSVGRELENGKRRRFLVALGLGVGALALALSAAALGLLGPARSGDSADRGLDSRRVLVGVFDNETGDPSLDHLGLMAADWITQGLTYTGFVDVVSLGTPLRSREPLAADGFDSLEGSQRLRAMATSQGMGTVVWGRYYLQGDSVHFQTHVTDAGNGEMLASLEPVTGVVDAPLKAVQELRDQVMARLATITDPRLAKWMRYASKPPTFEAYREFITGVELHTTVNYEAGRPYFLRAAALDSTFTMPLLWAIMGLAPAADSIAEALNRRRDQLAPLDRHFLDYLTATDWVAKLTAIRRVVEIAPGSDYLTIAGHAALRLNRPRQTLQFLLQADPEGGWLSGWTPYWNSVTTAYHLLGEHDRELEAARESRRLHPDEGATTFYTARALAALGRVEPILANVEGALRTGAHVYPAMAARELYAHGHRAAASDVLDRAIEWYRRNGEGRTHLARALALAGSLDESRSILEHLAAEEPEDVGVLVDLAALAARQGDQEEAEQIYRWLEEHGPASPMYEVYHINDRVGRPRWHYSYAQAQIAAALGERARAVELLREAADRSLLRPHLDFHANPYLEPLWNYPPFKELLRPKG